MIWPFLTLDIALYLELKKPQKKHEATKENDEVLSLRSLEGCGSAGHRDGITMSSWLWSWAITVIPRLGHTWSPSIFVWKRVSMLQLALPCSSGWHEETKLQRDLDLFLKGNMNKTLVHVAFHVALFPRI